MKLLLSIIIIISSSSSSSIIIICIVIVIIMPGCLLCEAGLRGHERAPFAPRAPAARAMTLQAFNWRSQPGCTSSEKSVVVQASAGKYRDVTQKLKLGAGCDDPSSGL